MSLKGLQEKPQASPDVLAATNALALCAIAYSLSRYLAARTAEALLDAASRLASSPFDVAVLTMAALWFISWSLDRHTKAAQILSTLHIKVLGSLLTQHQQLQLHKSAAAAVGHLKPGGGGVGAGAGAGRMPALRKLGPTASPTAPDSPASAKEISSFRLPELQGGRKGGSGSNGNGGSGGRRRGGAKQQQRWSVDTARPEGRSPQQPGGLVIQPKPRMSVDFDVAAAGTPTRRSPAQRHSRRSGTADHRGAPLLAEAAGAATPTAGSAPSTSGLDAAATATATGTAGSPAMQVPPQRLCQSAEKWQPRMARIASGQQLADLAAGRGSMDSVGSGRSASLPATPTARGGGGSGASASLDTAAGAATAAAVVASAAPAAAAPPTASTTASSGSPSPSPLASWLPFTGAGLLLSGADGCGAAATPDAATAAAAAAAVGQWVASTSTACAAWASSTVDTVLRPLIPGGSRPLEGLLWRSGSTPLPGGSSSEALGLGLGGPSPSLPLPDTSSGGGVGGVQGVLASVVAGDHSYAHDRRRQSIDGVSARHYTQGGVTADPSRKQALENLACAARLQSCSSMALAGGGQHPPGHLAALSFGGSGTGSGTGTLGADAGCSALASVGLDGDCPQDIREHVTDEHLLQFAAVAGEEAARVAAAQLALPPAWGAPWQHCLMGPCDNNSRSNSSSSSSDGGAVAAADAFGGDEGWEQVIHRSEGGLSYEVWRRPLRGGLFMYRSRALFQGVSPKDLRPFHLDDHARHLWDENVIEIRRVKPEGTPRLHKHSEWCLHQYRSRFPRPLAAREYQYARRVWHRPSDGGCYVLCRGQALPDAGDGYRAVRVTDFASGCVIRAVPAPHGSGSAGNGPVASEMLSLYFEDSLVRAGLAKMAVKGMWGYMQKYDAALRVFAEARQVAAAQHSHHSTAGGRAGGFLSARRRSLDGAGGDQPPRRRRQLLPFLSALPGGGFSGDGADSDGGSSSGDDALHSTYAAMRQRLHRAAAGAGSRLGPMRGGGGRGGAGGSGGEDGARGKARWAGRLVILAGIKMVHAMLAARR